MPVKFTPTLYKNHVSFNYPSLALYRFMKKLLVIVLLLVYGSSSSGMTLHFHYCCGKLAKIDLEPIEKKDCKGEHKELRRTLCCQSQSLELKLSDDQQFREWQQHDFKATSAEPCSIQIATASIHPDPASSNPICNSPPLPSQALFIYHCVFRI
jgi:hypothetical protein